MFPYIGNIYLAAQEEQTAQQRCLSRTHHFTIRSLPEYGKYEDSADICDDDIDAESESDKGDDGEEGEAACGAKYGQVSGRKRQRGGRTSAAVVMDVEEPVGLVGATKCDCSHCI